MTFTFAKANAAKLVRLPVYALAALLARLMPRQRHLWVFGRKTGVGEGPLRLWRLAQRYYPQVRLVWLAQDERQMEEARSLGLEVYRRDSWQARWLTLRAGVGVVTHGMGDLYRPFVPGIRLIQLWHGAPLKLLHLDAEHVHVVGQGALARLGGYPMRLAFASSARLIHLLPSPSPMVSERLRTAWGYGDLRRIRVTGDPRNDVLLDGEADHRRAQARALLEQLWGVDHLPGKLVMFAPTWRDGEEDPTLPRRQALLALDRMLAANDAWLIVRSHPWGIAQAEDAAIDRERSRVRFLGTDLLNDVNQVLNAIDVLVTDYSAIAMDYSLLERPIVFLAPDLRDYVKKRGMYEDYAGFTGGAWHEDWTGAMTALDGVLSNADSYAQLARQTGVRLCRRYHQHVDADSGRRVLQQVARLVGLPPPREPESPTRVLHVAGCLGGVETYLQLLATYNDPHRLELSFVVPRECDLSRYAHAHDMPAYVVPMKREIAAWADLKAALALRRLVHELRPDVLHLHSSKAGLLGRLACLGLPVGMVYTPHAYFYLGKRGWRRHLFLLAEQALDRVARSYVLGTSPSEERRAIDEVGSAPSRTSHILNTVDAQRLASRRVVLSQRRHVLLVARVSAQKNIPMFLAMVRHLRERVDAPCYLIGVGHYADDRRQLASAMRDAGLQPEDVQVVEWLPREELIELMAAAAVVVLTSVYESFGYVLAEANCLGVPVVGTDVDGIRDVIRHEHNGFLVPLDDATAMAKYVQDLIESVDRWNAMSMAAQDEGDHRFDIRRAMPLFEAYYTGIARGR